MITFFIASPQIAMLYLLIDTLSMETLLLGMVAYSAIKEYQVNGRVYRDKTPSQQCERFAPLP